MPITAKLDEFGKPAWIALTVLGFMIWWPVGLASLAFIIGSGRMGCGRFGGMHRWERRGGRMGGPFWSQQSSGNRAFDEYRQDTLRRLEEEQAEFKGFLDRLRHAKDKAEFDQFMSEHRTRPTPPPTNDQPQG